MPDQHPHVFLDLTEGITEPELTRDVHSQKHFNCSEFRATILRHCLLNSIMMSWETFLCCLYPMK